MNPKIDHGLASLQSFINNATRLMRLKPIGYTGIAVCFVGGFYLHHSQITHQSGPDIRNAVTDAADKICSRSGFIDMSKAGSTRCLEVAAEDADALRKEIYQDWTTPEDELTPSTPDPLSARVLYPVSTHGL